MRIQRTLVPLLLLAVSPWKSGAAQVEELPPPAQETVEKPAEQPESESVLVTREPAVSTSSSVNWAVVGPRGRIYCAGETALVDYWQDGRRKIAALDAEDPATHATPDDDFRYFREKSTGHRWAIARYSGADGGHRVYFQEADRRGEWQLFQRGEAALEGQPGFAPPTSLFWTEAVSVDWPFADGWLYFP